MTHYDIGRWADLVRGCAEGEEEERLKRHLAEGCERCEAVVSSLRRVSEAARHERRQRPPDSALRWVQAYFALQRPAAEARSVSVLELAFDTAIAPRRAGVRDGESASRELRFESSEYALVVSLQESERADHALLAGQLLTREGQPLTGIPAGVLADDELLANAYTGELGYFEIDFPTRFPVELRLLPHPDTQIRARIDGP